MSRVSVILLSNSLQFYRVKDWFYLVPIIFLGMLFENTHFYKYGDKLALSLVLSTTYFAFGYAFNDMADRKVKRAEWILVGIPFVLLYIEAAVFFPLLVVFLLGVHILNLLYSYPPLCLKRRYVFSVLVNAVTFGSLFVFGAYIQKGLFTSSAVSMGAVLAYVFVPLQLVHEWSHLEEDKRKRTDTVNRGYYYSILFSFLFLPVISAVADACLGMKKIFFLSSVLFALIGAGIVVKYGRHFPLPDKIKEIRKKLRLWGIFYGCGWAAGFILKNVS